MISGNWQSFKSTYKTKWKWPTEKFGDAGERVKLADVFDLPYNIIDQHAAMLLWCNGGAPRNRWGHTKSFAFEINRFLSIGVSSDLSQTILWARNYIPRFSVPLAYVENVMGDIAFFLTFPRDEAKL